MLFADRVKYLTLVLGLSFAVLLISQQGAIFVGLMLRATGPLQNISQPDLWVTDSATQYISEFRSLRNAEVDIVRGVRGVRWASPLFVGRGLLELPDNRIHSAQIIGIDRATLIGRPPEMVAGRIEDIRRPEAIIVDSAGLRKLGGLGVGDSVRLNDRRAVIVGVCRARSGFDSNVLAYTTIDNAEAYVPGGRKRLSYVLVKTEPGADRRAVARRISALPSLAAYTRDQMRSRTIRWVIIQTGIGLNFGITVLLGLIVGMVIAAAVLYQFTNENSRHLAVLRAMGAQTRTLVMMVLVQGMTVGMLGFGIGVGLAGAFGIVGQRPDAQLVAVFPWQLMLVALAAMLLCVTAGSLLSLVRVIHLEPAEVFK